MALSALLLEDIVRRALAEDLGHGRDVTSESIIPPDAKARAAMVARQSGVLAGIEAAQTAFTLVGADVKIRAHDGDRLSTGQKIMDVTGDARAVMTAERTALNLISHLSGIATRTAQYVDVVRGTNAAIADTRKTLPGLRALQKYAVRMGGGVNHRFGLDDAVLIKDNHIAIAGGIGKAIRAALAHAGHMVKIEIEVDTLEQLAEALEYKIDAVLLDNMAPDMLRRAVSFVDGRVTVEASGGITLDNVRAVAETGVDLISIGALTHSVTALDIGLDISA